MNRLVLLLMLCVSALLVQGQGKVYIKNIQGAQGSGNSMYYALPMTELDIDVYATQTQLQAGPYWKYAEKYLGEKAAITENSTIYKINKIVIRSEGIPDTNHFYQVTVTGNAAAAFLSLTPEGLIKGVNISGLPEDNDVPNAPDNSLNSPPVSQPLSTEAMVKAGAMFKEAEEAANQIFRLREGRTALITGESAAGASGSDAKTMLDELNKQEKQLVEQFTGIVTSKTYFQTVKYIPQEEKMQGIAFRFSKYRGVVDVDDLSGDPINIDIKKQTSISLPAVAPLTPDEEKKRKRQDDDRMGFFYRRPAKADISLTMYGQVYAQIQCDIAQFGEILSLPHEIGERQDSRIIFFPKTGAIKEISRTK